MDRKRAILRGDMRIGVWGVGHIGYSTMAHFSESGATCIGFDIDPVRMEQLNKGESPIFAMDYWIGFSAEYLFRSGAARVTSNWEDMLAADVGVHFICVPTERKGTPWLEPLMDVIEKISRFRERQDGVPPLVIVESTLTPGTMDAHVIPALKKSGLEVGTDILVGCAPRRDWFSSADKSLRTLPRVFGGVNDLSTDQMRSVLSLVCEQLVEAPTHFYAEMVKSIENAYRHAEVGLAFELSRAYPSLDIRKVLELVGTKWNVGTFHPSFGVGGYCIPLSSHYVIDGAERPEELHILKQAIKTCESQPEELAKSLIDTGVKKVGIMGLAYTENVKVWAASPALTVSRLLIEAGIDVKVHDPHYNAEEIKSLTGCESFDPPSGLEEFDAVLMVAGHREYRLINHNALLMNLKNCKLVLDNAGLWAEVDFASKGIEYHQPGQSNWLANGRGHADRAVATPAQENKPAGVRTGSVT